MHVIISGNKNVVKVNFDKEGLDYTRDFDRFGNKKNPFLRKYNRVITYEEALEDVIAWLVKEQIIANNKQRYGARARSIIEGNSVLKLKIYAGVKRYLKDFELQNIQEELSPLIDFTVEDVAAMVKDIIMYFVFIELNRI